MERAAKVTSWLVHLAYAGHELRLYIGRHHQCYRRQEVKIILTGSQAIVHVQRWVTCIFPLVSM
jgi:hypothetical protein